MLSPALWIPDAHDFLVHVLARPPGIRPDVLLEVLVAAGQVVGRAPADLRRTLALLPVVPQALGVARVGQPPGAVVGAGGGDDLVFALHAATRLQRLVGVLDVPAVVEQ